MAREKNNRSIVVLDDPVLEDETQEVETSEISIQDLKTPEDRETGYLGNFDFFIKAKIVPKRIKCSGYWEAHRFDAGCHTNLPYDVPTILSHVKGQHGGGFELVVGRSRGAWKGWKDLGDIPNLIISNFICGTCRKKVNLDPQSVLEHLKPHINANRRISQGGKFYITVELVNLDAPIFVDIDEEAENVELIDFT